ncbi:UDP-glycosyltransferase UGT5-like [Anastrepha obliqua]|uniref:UDP-glycosyltransferase UGT5-like n=1 Tax=Anastrepha obliqua TaxID=95512 RepID=UPI00240989F3|nr:UDP-glycosyltransferase UGT5-like [Anastrepha obliqua]
MKYYCYTMADRSKLIVVALMALIAITTSVQPVHSANILGVFLSPSPSHLIVHMSIMKTLAEQGHNVTVVSGQKPKVTHEKIHNIIIEPSEEHQREMEQELSAMGVKKQNVVVMLMKFLMANNVLTKMQYDALRNERFQSIYESKFDLVILGYFVNNFKFIVPAKLNCPVIISWTGPPMEMVNGFVGVPPEMTYVPSTFTPYKNGELLSFGLRMFNTFTSYAMRLLVVIMDISLNSYYKTLAEGDPTIRSYSQMLANVSLVFCNSHFSEGPIRPLVPGLVEIGGIQIKEKPDPLPKELEKFLNASNKNGAILFSLGSNMKGSNIQPATVQILFKVLSSLEQNVIWKWEDLANTPGNASNIFYQKWLPQDDILAHPNLKLFITHAGKGGMVEATYHGVPMVAMPIFAEQPVNAAKIVSSGYGIKVDILNLKEDDFRAAILEVLNNPVYRYNVRKFAKLYRDRPLSARESVVYWVEYVLRHHGAAHMQSPLVRMNFIQSSGLDVFFVYFAILYALWRLGKLALANLCKLIRKVRGSFKSKREKLKKQ